MKAALVCARKHSTLGKEYIDDGYRGALLDLVVDSLIAARTDRIRDRIE